ncbi:MAG: DUF4332 domain-containing protein [Saprospiraceae bacterium]|nr:DUF4332 domain-containing protein [Saprospiraceae bacterium]
MTAKAAKAAKAATTAVDTAEPTPAATTKKKEPKATKATKAADDLTKIEGIGPKIAELLNGAGISTFAQLLATPASDVKKVLESGGKKYTMHDPKTWAQQAKLADAGKWDELKSLQDDLKGGK